jgi:hypothetical protein
MVPRPTAIERSTARRMPGSDHQNGSARKAPVEAAYRHSAGVGLHQRRQQIAAASAWHCIEGAKPLCARYRRLVAKGKRNTAAITPIACQITAFLWAIAQVGPRPPLPARSSVQSRPLLLVRITMHPGPGPVGRQAASGRVTQRGATTDPAVSVTDWAATKRRRLRPLT